MKKLFILILIMFVFIPSTCLAVPSKPGENKNILHKGLLTISDNKIFDSKNYSSTTAGENAILVTGGESSLNSCTINKKGSLDTEEADFYGTNAGVLVKNGTLNIKNNTIIGKIALIITY